MIRQVQAAIHRDYWQDTVIPNTYINGWFECDVARITKAKIWWEYEIKISRSDFLADKKKHTTDWYKRVCFRKFDLLEEGKGPNRFVYVVPEELGSFALQSAPEFAGVASFRERRQADRSLMIITTVRRAKVLHRNKFEDWQHIAHKLSCRLWGEGEK